MLTRTLTEHEGFQWTLALGGMSLPKQCWTAKTVEAAIKSAEKSLL
jgi:hypothetical protein